MHKNIKKREINYNLEDVLGAPPKGLSYYGSGLIFVIVILLVTLAGLVEYPETIQSEIYLTSENPPRKIVSPQSSYIDSIFFKDGDYILKNTPIISFKNDANYNDINWLKKNVIEQTLENILLNNISLKKINISFIQPKYDLFKKAIEQYRLNNRHSLILLRIESSQNQIEIYKKHIFQIKNNLHLLNKKKSISTSNLETDSILTSKGYVSKFNYRELQIKDINDNYQLSEEQKELYEIELKIQQLKELIAILNLELKNEIINSKNNILMKHNVLVNAYKSWINKNYIFTNINGKLHFNNKHWVKGAFVSQGVEMLKITPLKNGEIFAFAKINDQGSSNVKIGQRVNIKLNNFPYKEYGVLVGVINNIVTTPSSDTYLVHVHFPKGLITSYNKKLNYTPQMKGKADILTRKQSLLTKVFYELKSIIYK
jgi:HlyD family secretion protein